MRECQTHCQETTASIDQMMTTMSQAQQSNDPAQMRETLAQVCRLRLPSPHHPHYQCHADRTGEHGECLDAERYGASQYGQHQQEEQWRCAAGRHQYQTCEARMTHTARHWGLTAF